MKFNYFLWIIYIIAFPFYVFAEGNPQIADAFGGLIILSSIKSILQNLTKNSFIRYALYFVVYALIVNTIWMILLKDLIIIKYSVFYLYSFLFAVFIYLNINDKKFLQLTFVAILISLVTQLLLWPFNQNQGGRVLMYFNNPNQLALWGVCLLVILNSIHILKKQKFSLVLAGSTLATFMVFLSASRAGVVCCILFWTFFYVKSRRNFIVLSVFALFISGYIITNKSFDFDNVSMLNTLTERLNKSTASNASVIGDRGFDRIYEFPQYLFFGAGEGLVERFNSPIEIHNTFLNVFFSYGIIGFIFFFLSLRNLFFKPYRVPMILFLILAFYANVHMTLRIPFFWITLFIIYYIKEKKEETYFNENSSN